MQKRMKTRQKNPKTKQTLGDLGSQTLFNMYNKWHWLVLFHICWEHFHIIPCPTTSYTKNFYAEPFLFIWKPLPSSSIGFLSVSSPSVSRILRVWTKQFSLLEFWHPLILPEMLRVEPNCSWAGIGLLSLGTVDELAKSLRVLFCIFETGS